MSTSNRTSLTNVRHELGELDLRLAAIQAGVSSNDAAQHIGRARAYLRAGAEVIKFSAHYAVDPVIDLPCGQPS